MNARSCLLVTVHTNTRSALALGVVHYIEHACAVHYMATGEQNQRTSDLEDQSASAHNVKLSECDVVMHVECSDEGKGIESAVPYCIHRAMSCQKHNSLQQIVLRNNSPGASSSLAVTLQHFLQNACNMCPPHCTMRDAMHDPRMNETRTRANARAVPRSTPHARTCPYPRRGENGMCVYRLRAP